MLGTSPFKTLQASTINLNIHLFIFFTDRPLRLLLRTARSEVKTEDGEYKSKIKVRTPLQLGPRPHIPLAHKESAEVFSSKLAHYYAYWSVPY